MEGLEIEGLKRAGFKMERLERDAQQDLFQSKLKNKTFHSATCNCIVEERKDVKLSSIFFLTNWELLRDFLYPPLREKQRMLQSTQKFVSERYIYSGSKYKVQHKQPVYLKKKGRASCLFKEKETSKLSL